MPQTSFRTFHINKLFVQQQKKKQLLPSVRRAAFEMKRIDHSIRYHLIYDNEEVHTISNFFEFEIFSSCNFYYHSHDSRLLSVAKHLKLCVKANVRCRQHVFNGFNTMLRSSILPE